MSTLFYYVLFLLISVSTTSGFITANSGGGIRACIGNSYAISILYENFTSENFYLNSISGTTWFAQMAYVTDPTYSKNWLNDCMNNDHCGPGKCSSDSDVSLSTLRNVGEEWVADIEEFMDIFIKNTSVNGRIFVYDYLIEVIPKRWAWGLSELFNISSLDLSFIDDTDEIGDTFVCNRNFNENFTCIDFDNGKKMENPVDILTTLSAASSAWAFAVVNHIVYLPYPCINGFSLVDAGLKYNLPIRETCEKFNSSFIAFDYSYEFDPSQTGYDILEKPIGFSINRVLKNYTNGCYAKVLEITTKPKGVTCNVLFVPFLGLTGAVLAQDLPTFALRCPRSAHTHDYTSYIDYGDMIENCKNQGAFEDFQTGSKLFEDVESNTTIEGSYCSAGNMISWGINHHIIMVLIIVISFEWFF